MVSLLPQDGFSPLCRMNWSKLTAYYAEEGNGEERKILEFRADDNPIAAAITAFESGTTKKMDLPA